MCGVCNKNASVGLKEGNILRSSLAYRASKWLDVSPTCNPPKAVGILSIPSVGQAGRREEAMHFESNEKPV